MEYWTKSTVVVSNSKVENRMAAEFRLMEDELAKSWVELIKGYDERVEEMAKLGHCRGGIYKLIPPDEWVKPMKDLSLLDGIENVLGEDTGARKERFVKGDGLTENIRIKKFVYKFDGGKYSIAEFYAMAERQGKGPLPKKANGQPMDADEAIEYFESEMDKKRAKPAFYISDFPVNLFHGPETSEGKIAASEVVPKGTGAELNFNDVQFDALRKVLSPTLNSHRLTGINTCTILCGGPMSSFCHHWEDGSLASVNYLHRGAPKIWIGISPHDVWKIYEAIHPLRQKCMNPMRHKDVFLTTKWLDEHGIEYEVLVQREGEIVVTRANAVHGGFNTGYNVAEATNFCSSEWLWILENDERALMPICCQKEALALTCQEKAKIIAVGKKMEAGIMDHQGDEAIKRKERRDNAPEEKKIEVKEKNKINMRAKRAAEPQEVKNARNAQRRADYAAKKSKNVE